MTQNRIGPQAAMAMVVAVAAALHCSPTSGCGNNTEGNPTDIPSRVSYVSNIDRETVLTDLRFDAVTMVNNGVTMYGVHVYDCPVGAILKLECNDISDCACALCYLPSADLDPVDQGIEHSSNICLMPIDGYIISGIYYYAIA